MQQKRQLPLKYTGELLITSSRGAQNANYGYSQSHPFPVVAKSFLHLITAFPHSIMLSQDAP